MALVQTGQQKTAIPFENSQAQRDAHAKTTTTDFAPIYVQTRCTW